MSAIIHMGADGWKARLDGDFTEENVARLADAAGALWDRDNPGSTVYVAYDARPEAKEFARLAAEVLSAYGLVVKLTDTATPMPALSWAVARDGAACGGVMITGSHRPAEYLSVKFRMADGACPTPDFNDDLEELIEAEPVGETGAFHSVAITPVYIKELMALVDRGAIANAHLKIVYDPMFGAACGVFAKALKGMGIEVREIHGVKNDETPEFHPSPVEPWMDDCEQAVVDGGAQAGFANDGDADRIGAVDERGRFVSPDKIAALLIGHLLKVRGESGRVVVNLSSSALVRRVAKDLGCRLTVKPIGFRHIYKEIERGDVLVGAEESGGIAFPAHMPERDGLLATLLLCELMAKTGKQLGKLVDELDQRYGKTSYGRRDLRLEAGRIEMLRTMLPGMNPREVAGMEPVAVSHMDGLKLEFEDESWVLLRPSATEALVRVYAEAATVEMRDSLLEEGCALAKGESFH